MSRPDDSDGRGPVDRAPVDLAALVRRHQAPIWRYLRLLGADAHEADDLMQETFVLAARRLGGGEGGGTSGARELVRRPAAFLRGVARNLLLGARRRRRSRPLEVSWCDAVDEFVSESPGAIEDERIDSLRACMKQLRGRSRDALEWHHVEGFESAEIARRLELGTNGLKSLLSRARQALRECVRQREEQEQVHD
ncbi:MAG: sigma-70 family RNA polymerase sigma factor [bacterium]|nr:sigma-70 family RNA polymerase sigma factor [bacterium]